jgi:hypothetical protein
LRRCEELSAALNFHRQGERNANERIVKLEADIANMKKPVKEIVKRVNMSNQVLRERM